MTEDKFACSPNRFSFKVDSTCMWTTRMMNRNCLQAGNKYVASRKIHSRVNFVNWIHLRPSSAWTKTYMLQMRICMNTQESLSTEGLLPASPTTWTHGDPLPHGNPHPYGNLPTTWVPPYHHHTDLFKPVHFLTSYRWTDKQTDRHDWKHYLIANYVCRR